jgi:cbb3-type cytochrome oxidase subunit 3
MNLDPQLGKAALTMSLFIVVMAVGMLVFLPPDSPQFAITVFTLAIGLIFLGAVVVLVRRFSR